MLRTFLGITTESPVSTPDLTRLKRSIHAISSTPGGSQTQIQRQIVYTPPPPEGESASAAKRRSQRHWAREVEALRHMSGANVAISAAQAQHKRDVRQRERESLQLEREVQVVVEDLLAQLERQHRHAQERVQHSWCCPAGCASLCARAAFREQCVPSAANIRSEQLKLWRRSMNVLRCGEFVGPSGYAYGSATQQQLYMEQEANLAECTPPELSASEVHAIQLTFLEAWDGKVPPDVWTRDWLEHGSIRKRQGVECSEYRGESSRSWGCDRFGPDFRPVGFIACARRGCSGCCYCHGMQQPVCLQFCVLTPAVWSPSMSCSREWLEPWARADLRWATLDMLREALQRLIDDVQHLRSRTIGGPWEPVPPCLLHRRWAPMHADDGRIVCVSGAVQSLLPAEELASWKLQLASCSMRLFVLDGSSLECTPSLAEKTSIDAYLAQHVQLVEEGKEEWEAQHKAKKALDEQVQFEAMQGCGLRLREPSDVHRTSFHEGDIIYVTPKFVAPGWPGYNYAVEQQPYVAVVSSICTFDSSLQKQGTSFAHRVPTGDLNLLIWDARRLQFTQQRPRRVSSEAFDGAVLLPPCCGRGASCTHLLQQERCQWPNGDAMCLDVLKPIPEAFAAFMSASVHERISMLNLRRNFPVPESKVQAWVQNLNQRFQGLLGSEHHITQYAHGVP